MSEYCREEHPLLEEVSEDSYYSPRYYRRGQMRSNSKHLKGAAAILTRWPDHWLSILSYWWIGVGMISITSFIIYNCLFAFSMLPSACLKSSKLIYETLGEKSTVNTSWTLNVFTHVFPEYSKEINVTDYLPYIENLSRKYVNYRYNLIVVINDTNSDWHSPGENNDRALNALLGNDKTTTKQESVMSNVQVQYITLSAYMDNSPLIKYWRILPPQLIEFLVRAVSIWDKGGIAFNPQILREKHQNELYIKKLHNLFNKYSHLTNNTNREINPVQKLLPTTTKSSHSKKHKQLNNIRDIIHYLNDEGDSTNDVSHEMLVGAENIVMPTILKTESYIYNKKSNVKKRSHQNSEINISTELSNENNIIHRNQISNINTNVGTLPNNNSKQSLLPLFINFLFHNNEKNKTRLDNSTTIENVNLSKSDKNSVSSHDSTESAGIVEKGLKPVIVAAPGIFDKFKNGNRQNNIFDTQQISKLHQLTIDLKGNIIATDTACHAFLGTIFSNAVHHRNEETVTDFIISELTIFCKGLLSSCRGIDLILL